MAGFILPNSIHLRASHFSSLNTQQRDAFPEGNLFHDFKTPVFGKINPTLRKYCLLHFFFFHFKIKDLCQPSHLANSRSELGSTFIWWASEALENAMEMLWITSAENYSCQNNYPGLMLQNLNTFAKDSAYQDIQLLGIGNRFLCSVFSIKKSPCNLFHQWF